MRPGHHRDWKEWTSHLDLIGEALGSPGTFCSQLVAEKAMLEPKKGGQPGSGSAVQLASVAGWEASGILERRDSNWIGCDRQSVP